MMNEAKDSRPVPDPTLLTTQQLNREIQSLREIIEARLDAGDEATRLRVLHAEDIPRQISQQVSHLENVMDEKFSGVDQRFIERDVRTEQAALAQTTAVNAALQAQKEAAGEQAKSFEKSVDKSERATAEQINSLRDTITTSSGALAAQIDDIKERMTRVESVALGRLNATQETRQQNNWAIGTAITIAGLALAVAVAFSARGG